MKKNCLHKEFIYVPRFLSHNLLLFYVAFCLGHSKEQFILCVSGIHFIIPIFYRKIGAIFS